MLDSLKDEVIHHRGLTTTGGAHEPTDGTNQPPATAREEENVQTCRLSDPNNGKGGYRLLQQRQGQQPTVDSNSAFSPFLLDKFATTGQYRKLIYLPANRFLSDEYRVPSSVSPTVRTLPKSRPAPPPPLPAPAAFPDTNVYHPKENN
ncbi:hypothetical protein RUM44_009867 [Polyplax serrata]|uniref:Uncharacterized protein n=1 Tax=Polyplax serrata TaxID=468196 RepID=A0ABR1ATW6_POLSC